MKIARLNYKYRQNASKLHKQVGDILRDPKGPFAGKRVYQEYPVVKVNPRYPNNSHAFDWVVIDLHLVIECHGEQHYNIVDFGGEGYERAADRFREQKRRDDAKMHAAEEVGFTYIVVPYKDYDLLNRDYLWDLYERCFNHEPVQRSGGLKDRTKQHRRKLYQENKKRLDALKHKRRSSYGPKIHGYSESIT
jgi:hypothetical protein